MSTGFSHVVASDSIFILFLPPNADLFIYIMVFVSASAENQGLVHVKQAFYH